MAAKIFEVGDVLPATTQLRISWEYDIGYDGYKSVYTNYDLILISDFGGGYVEIDGTIIYDMDGLGGYDYPNYTNGSGDHAYIDIDTSAWSLAKRTVTSIGIGSYDCYWEDLNAPSGYTITFNSNGGTTISDIEDATELPTPLPPPTKSGYTFVAWYYDSAFTQIANPGDTIESNITLYAKWELNTYTITFEENGGTTIPDIEEATELPNPLPIPTKENHSFIAWYYDSVFTQIANAGDTLESNVTLYAKWGLTNGPKVFQVGDVLPAGIIKIEVSLYNSGDFYEPATTVFFNDTNWISFGGAEDDGQDVIAYVSILPTLSANYQIIDDTNAEDEAWYERRYMDAEIIIDFSNCSLEERTVTSIEVSSTHGGIYPTWEVVLPDYLITFEENGGTSVTNLIERTALPNPLPTTTKPGYTFGGWYYESNFQTRAKAGDTIEANTTLYAKWLTLAQVLEHINNVVEELRSAIINKGGDAEGKLLIDFATIINSLKTYEVVETLAELELLEPTLNRIVFVVEGSGELTMGAPVKVTQDGDTLIIG